MRHFKGEFRYAVLPLWQKKKNKNKDVVLWIITVVLTAVAIFWYFKK